jgi:hypothetical protein
MILASHGIIGSQIASFDADAAAFFARVTAAGGSLSTTEKIATNQLILDLKANSLWTPMKVIYPMVGGSKESCAQNLKSNTFNGTFTTNWQFTNLGAKPNGTSDYMDTTFNPSTNLSSSSFSIGVYRNLWTSGGSDIAFYAALDSLYYLQSTATSEVSIAFSTVQTQTYSELSHLGLFMTNALDGTSKGYKNGVAKLTKTTAGTIPSSNSYLGANRFNVGVEWASARYAFAYYSDGLTDTQAVNLYTAVQAFQTTLSRQV